MYRLVVVGGWHATHVITVVPRSSTTYARPSARLESPVRSNQASNVVATHSTVAGGCGPKLRDISSAAATTSAGAAARADRRLPVSWTPPRSEGTATTTAIITAAVANAATPAPSRTRRRRAT